MGVQFTDAKLDTVQKPGVGHLVHLLALQNATAHTLHFQDVLFCSWFCCEVCQLHPAVIMIVGTELLLLRGAPRSGAESFVPAT